MAEKEIGKLVKAHANGVEIVSMAADADDDADFVRASFIIIANAAHNGSTITVTIEPHLTDRKD